MTNGLTRNVRLLSLLIFCVINTNTYVTAQLDTIYIDSLINILDRKSPVDTVRIAITLKAADKMFFYDQDKTIQLLRKIDPIINQGSKQQKIDQLHYYGAAYQYKGNLDSTEYYNTTILDQISKEEDERRYARALANLGVVYRLKGELDMAIKIYEDVYEIFSARSDTFPIGVNRNSLGLIYDARGDYKAAMKMYLEALDIFKMLDNKGVQSIVLNNIGRVYNAQKDYDKALEYFKIYLSVSEEINNPNGIATATNNIGSVFSELNELDSSEYYLKKSIDKKYEINRLSELPASLNVLGKIYNLKGNYEEAIRLNEEALAIATENEMKKDMSYILLELGRSYDHLGQRTKARSFYNQALGHAASMGDVKLLFNINNALYESYRSTDTELALKYLEETYELNDSILNTENTEEITAMRLENEFNEKELINQQRIAALEYQENMQASRLSNQRIIIIGLLSLLVLLSYLIYQIFSQKNKIELQNEIISKSLKEKDILLREIHHRVKNNLQVISSLLGIQSRKVKDEAAFEALQEGRTRVQSMSLIHQNLYKKDNLTGIEIRDYFQKLVINLFDTYNISDEEITIESDIDDLKLDVDTVIPLGLVINELISNALKYAFPNKAGKVHVSLKEMEDGLHLSVKDDGIGITNPQDVLKNDSYGYDLITSLVDKLEGKLIIKNDNGTQVDAIFKEYKKAA